MNDIAYDLITIIKQNGMKVDWQSILIMHIL